jgi:hypothetical protein
MKKIKKRKNKKTQEFKLKKNVRLKSLNPANVPRVRKEFLDADYLKDLTPEQLRWYAQFTDEWLGGNVRKTKAGKVKAGHIHNTKELAKDCYDRNNWRNNDVYGVTKANYLMSDLDSALENQDGWYVKDFQKTEEALVHDIDEKKFETVLLTLEEFLKVKNNMNPELVAMYKKYYKLK